MVLPPFFSVLFFSEEKKITLEFGGVLFKLFSELCSRYSHVISTLLRFEVD